MQYVWEMNLFVMKKKQTQTLRVLINTANSCVCHRKTHLDILN